MTEPTVKWEAWTPSQAADVLENHNDHNLPLRNRLTLRYAADMSKGRWTRNGETVKVADTGTLIDGQHRLAAIVLSQTTQELLTVRGLPMESQRTVDSGRTRHIGTVLTLDGVRNATTVGSVARRILAWQNGSRKDIARPHVEATPSEIMDFVDATPSIETIHAPRAMYVRANTAIPPTMTGVASWLFTEIDEADSIDFFDRLAGGMGMAKEHPIMGLRRIAITHSVSRKRQADWIWLALLIKAWNMYRVGATSEVFTFRVGGATPEGFPEPK